MEQLSTDQVLLLEKNVVQLKGHATFPEPLRTFQPRQLDHQFDQLDVSSEVSLHQ